MELFRDFASVAFVIALAGFAAYWLKRGGGRASTRSWIGGGASNRIRLIQRLALTPQHWLCLIQIDDTEWIVSIAPNGISVLKDGTQASAKLSATDRKEFLS